jgi:hypothetical protein
VGLSTVSLKIFEGYSPSPLVTLVLLVLNVDKEVVGPGESTIGGRI